PPASVGRGMLALGGPDFNARPADAAFESGAATVASSQGTTPTLLARAGAYRGPTAGCETFRTLRFDQVPGAAAEAVGVGSAWLSRPDPSDEPVMTLTGARASESAFKQMAPGRRILHLATHGFFVQDKCESAIAGGALTARSDNPLLLTGLALAGANRRH